MNIEWSSLLKEGAIAGFVGTLLLVLMYCGIKYFLIGLGKYFDKTEPKKNFKSLN